MKATYVAVVLTHVICADSSHKTWHRRQPPPRHNYVRAMDPDLLPDRSAPAAMLFLDTTVVPEEGGCNGYVRYCNKRISQVLWMGAHNALSDVGFALQRNQFVSGPQLLDAGIRYFDVDSCAYDKHGERISPVVCHGYSWWRTQVYQPTEAGLVPIKHWLDIHPREVIFLNFGDLSDFTAPDDNGDATPTPRLQHEVVAVVRQVFGDMVILRHDPMDLEVRAGTARLEDLIIANRRVIVSVDKVESQDLLFWGQDDRVCNDEWYEDSLHVDVFHADYAWKPVWEHIETTMRQPCAHSLLPLRKLEFAFFTALGGTIDSSHVGDALATYLDGLHNATTAYSGPFEPFNLILTDHSDKWSRYYAQWHAAHIESYRY
ncbi:hypothetical protein DYB31_007935 [Aphanomyces astaci]|uniref:Uncharacterized protein n=1 Tax=Aphanomyces astaci TaxID=112090 RepID=A0A397EDN8_APHAT|nr:hypothetical protein DYB31_007935 [Aphanomyces astaci]